MKISPGNEKDHHNGTDGLGGPVTARPGSGYSPPYPEAVCRHIEVLASDEFQGRKPGTAGEEKTIRYIEEQFRQIGLEPGNGDSYLQRIDLAVTTR